jgi:co-chaperonin GroES (HSP10)
MRLLHDWILVELDPIVEREGSIVLLHGQAVRTATVRAVGPGRALPTGARVPVGVTPGDRIAFRREHLEHKPGKQILAVLQEIGENLGLLRAPDILYVMEHGS